MKNMRDRNARALPPKKTKSWTFFFKKRQRKEKFALSVHQIFVTEAT